MNILEAKYLNTDVELILDFEEELLFLNQIIGDMSTEEQLSAVKHYITREGQEEMLDMVGAYAIDNEGTNVNKFNTRMGFLLLEIQFPLGAKPLKLRGGGSSNYL